MRFKIASWNVNSLRVRLPHIITWISTHHPDVLAIQETKVPDELFPIQALEEAGYHVICTGQKAYNGSAILSKKPLACVEKGIPAMPQTERRVLGASLGEIRIWNVYVPNGEAVHSEKYQYKLSWLDQLKNFLTTELKSYPQLLVLGDFNIAPAPKDVYDALALEGRVLFSAAERTKLQQLFDLGLEDCFRLHHPEEKEYTWWDYRLNAFKRNLGLRIDHILASPALAKQSIGCNIDKTPRGWERPSDHAPIFAEFEIP